MGVSVVWKKGGSADGGHTLFFAAASFSLAFAASSSESGIAVGQGGGCLAGGVEVR